VTAPPERPWGFVPIAVFFFFGAVMGTLAAVTLLWPGTALDRAWRLNPTAHDSLVPLGRMIGVPFLILALALLLAAFGWLGRRRWGWLLGTTIIAVNLIGDLIHVLTGEWVKGGVGVIIAGLLLIYLTRRGVRGYFHA
jgi:hypothetical protein